MKESISLAKHQQISKNFKIDYNNIRELLYEKVKVRSDEIFLICPGENVQLNLRIWTVKIINKKYI